MSTLAGRQIRDTYADTFHIENANTGVDNVLRVVEDGVGNSTALALANNAVRISGTLNVTGVASFDVVPNINGAKIWSSGNDGPGSGLNADLLDGFEATAFAQAGQNTTVTADWGFTGVLAMTGNRASLAHATPLQIRNNADTAFLDVVTIDNADEITIGDSGTTMDLVGSNVTVNGQPIATGGGVPALLNNEFITAENFTGVPQTLIGIANTNIAEIGSTLSPVLVRTGETGTFFILQEDGGQEANIRFTTDTNPNQANSNKGEIGYLGGVNADDFTIINRLNDATLTLNQLGASGMIQMKLNNSLRFETDQTNTRLWHGSELLTARPALQTEYWDDAGRSSSLRILDGAGTLRSVGFNQVIPQDVSNASNIFDKDGINQYLTFTGSSTVTWTIQNMGISGELGQQMYGSNRGTATLIISAGSGRTLNWFDGSGTLKTGNRTIAINGRFTITRRTSTEFDIWGDGIS